ncbi:hypothetical protein DRH27_05880 [Candidatus Falkowbacteria bacterium]|nr:MAG: hypothetical protein DRH27_05880 [Candidatus Falkowbacteria bacterium]
MARATRIAGVSQVVATQGSTVLAFKVAGTHSITPTGTEREALVGAGGVAGYAERPAVAVIEIEIFDSPDLSFEQIGRLSDVTVTSELATGKQYILRGWLANQPELSGNDGTATLRFEGPQVEEIIVSS